MSGEPSPRAWRSLAGKIAVRFAAILTLMAGLAAVASRFELAPWLVFLVILALGLPLGLYLVDRLLHPLGDVVRAVGDGLSSLEDGDYSMRLAVTRDDELGELVRRYNQTVDVLRDERSAIRQRELLLETALYRSPLGIVLTNSASRVVYANPEAARLFLGGGKLEGRAFDEVLAGCPAELREILASGTDGLFSLERDSGETETYHLSLRQFRLNQRRHDLLLLRRLTPELAREEARIWKQVIRVINHELNNSLAPISSLMHSAGVVAERPGERRRLREIFAAIEDRVAHLTRFLEGYARFARLPQPRKEVVEWLPFLEGVRRLYSFELAAETAELTGWFDPAQMEQVLINLLKNAHEASEEGGGIVVRLGPDPDGGTRLEVLDRGRGMSPEVMRSALLPFYSTKKDGVGVGLPLCREIVAGHGGRLRLQERQGGGVVVTCWLPPPPATPARSGSYHQRQDIE